MTTVFVYEDVTSTWAEGDSPSSPAQSLLAEGQAMLDAVAADFSALPDVSLAQSRSFLENAASSDHTLLIAPETDGRLEYLAREVIRVGGRLLGASPESVRITSDKLALARHWENHGVATPRTWPVGTAPLDGRIVTKPRDGAGSQNMELGIPDAERSRLPLIAQEYVEGFAASVAFLIGDRKAIPLLPCQQLLSSDGRFQYLGGRLPIEATLAQRATRIALLAVTAVPGLRGYVGVDVVLGDDGHDWAIEINPRLTTSYVGLRAIAKFNLAGAMLNVIRGNILPKLEWHDRSIGFTPDGRISG